MNLTYRVKSAHKLKLTDKQLLQWTLPIILIMVGVNNQLVLFKTICKGDLPLYMDHLRPPKHCGCPVGEVENTKYERKSCYITFIQFELFISQKRANLLLIFSLRSNNSVVFQKKMYHKNIFSDKKQENSQPDNFPSGQRFSRKDKKKFSA